MWHSRRLYWRRPLPHHRCATARAAGWLGLDRLAGAFGCGDPREHSRCTRYDDFWGLLLLLPDNSVLIAGAALVGMEARMTLAWMLSRPLALVATRALVKSPTAIAWIRIT